MTNWTEVNVYTGRPVDEDAPTNFAGAGSGVDMNPTGMKKKKKKLIDARSKSYKTHRAKLETARVKREAKRNGVQEEVELNEYKKAEIKFNKGSIKTALPKVLKHINLINKKMKVKIKVTQNMSDDSLTLDGGKYDINREVADIINFIGGKNAKVVESVNEADDYKPHMMYDPKTGKGYKANTMDDHLRMKKMGYDHEAPKKEEVERKTFSQKVKESISEFGVESLLAEDNVDVLRSIVKRKSAKPIKFKDGTMTIDMQTANMMLTVLDKVKPANQKKLTAMMNGKKSEFMKVHGFVMKALGK
jgi:hypothetical protein